MRLRVSPSVFHINLNVICPRCRVWPQPDPRAVLHRQRDSSSVPVPRQHGPTSPALPVTARPCACDGARTAGLVTTDSVPTSDWRYKRDTDGSDFFFGRGGKNGTVGGIHSRNGVVPDSLASHVHLLSPSAGAWRWKRAAPTSNTMNTSTSRAGMAGAVVVGSVPIHHRTRDSSVASRKVDAANPTVP